MSPPTPLLRLPVAALLAVLGGLAVFAAFPPISFAPSAPVGVALLTAALWGSRARRGVGLGFASGVAFFLPLLSWMTVIGQDAWVLLALWCGAWSMLIGLITALGSRLPGAPVWIASGWVLAEGLRGREPWGGFPWGSLSFSQADAALADWAAVAGTPVVTFVVALIGASLTALAVALTASRYRAALAFALTLVAAVALAPLLGPLATPPASAGEATIAIVQGGTPQTGMGAMDVRQAVLDNHIGQTLNLASAIDSGEVAAPDFVLWPENSSDLDPFADPAVADAITATARAVGVPILVGVVTTVPDNPSQVWNAGIVWDPERGPSAMYVKTRPVPFGEFIPFREQLAPIVGRFDRIPRDFAAGTTPGNLDIGGVAVGNVICFEIAYGDVVEAVVDGGAQVITVQTNNATYQGTAQPEQQLQIERMRATETGRTVLVAATSGISAVIAPDRVITHRIDEGDTGWLVVDVPLVEEPTWATAYGRAAEWVIVLFALVAIGWSLAARLVRDRGRVDSPVTSTSA
ncbi:MAG: apolipoprotein N-acyltransferase [Candidatus Nanopelagicales bacterium]|nr:apolipoprotein N-acyltransferase [Candidatus Nanopelagicales bacterium]MCF8542465.1 apolipoprotein N-acyltransferase [Candidatus Nanopelagicales bacterium]